MFGENMFFCFFLLEQLRQAAAMFGENMHGDAGKAGVAGKRTK